MSAIRWSACIGIASVLAAGACSDSTEPEEESLTRDEATGLLLALRTAVNSGAETIQPIFASPDSTIVPCPLNGTAKLVGMIEEGEPIEGSATLKTDFQVTPRGCRVQGGGLVFTVDGNPGVRDVVAAVIDIQTFQILIEGTLTGTLDWELAGRTGSCAIDLTLGGEPDLSGAGPSFTASYTGTLCGYDVDIDATNLVVPIG